MDRPFLQTPEWLAFQKFLGRHVWRVDDGFIKANIIRHDVRLGQNWLYIPYGPELNLDMAKDGFRNEISHFAAFLRGLARQQGSMFVKIEPTHDMVVELLFRSGIKLKKSLRHVQPMFTTVAELTLSEDELLDTLHHKHRYNINLAERKGVMTEEAHDVEAFWTMLKATSRQDDFRPHPMLYYKKLMNFFSQGNLRTRLWFAYHGGRPIAGILTLEHAGTVYYLHGASDREYRALMAPHVLHWNVMLDAKRRGFKWYDFWGIDAAKWPGVTRFKLGFGGKLVEYPGSFDLVRKPFFRWAYNTIPR
jgi:lipid II:glycine glycyltransferase (peptidoglycan interpeptide bridge formation enzyme)